MSEIIPLPIRPYTPEIIATLRQAKARIATDIQLRPVEAIPGGPQPILLFGIEPEWPADHIKIRPDGIHDVGRVEAALRHWLNGGAPTITAADVLSNWMGCRVEEITDPLHLDHVDLELEKQKARLSNGR